MSKAVIDLRNEVLNRELRTTWRVHAKRLHESMDEYLQAKGDEKSTLYECALQLNHVETLFKFPLRDYKKWFNVDDNEVLEYIKDYIRCRREGIPVLKIELNLYQKFSKYLWSPEKLIRSKEKINFSDELQKKRMLFILCDHVVYIEENTLFRNERAVWVPKIIRFCYDFMRFDWPKSNRTVNIPPRYLTVKDKFLCHTNYPYYRDDNDFDLIKHLVDFMYCIEFNIEKEKIWSFEFPTKFDYLATPKLSKSKSTEAATKTPDVGNVDVASSATSTSKDVVVNFAKASFSTTTSKVVTDSLSGPSTHKEMNFEKLQNSLKVSDQFVMDTIHKSKALSLKPELHNDMVRKRLVIFTKTYPMAESAVQKRYEKVLFYEIPFRIKFLKSQVQKTFTDFKMDMEMFHHTHHDHEEDFATKSVDGRWEKELKKKINEGKLLMDALEFNYGFHLGLVEDAVLPDSAQAWRGASDRCCFCPLNWSAKQANEENELKCFDESSNPLQKDDWFGSSVSKISGDCCKCEKTGHMTREELLIHLGSRAHKLGCHYHLATLKYVTHVCLLDTKKAHMKTLSEIETIDYMSQRNRYRNTMLMKKKRKKEIQKVFMLEQEQILAKEEEKSEKESVEDDNEDENMTPVNGVESEEE